jgi:hypothetical protein
MAKPRTLALLVVIALTMTAPAAAEDDPVPTADSALTLQSFNESPGCGGPDGIRGPFATRSGTLPDSEPILGPWGDFYGRTIGDVRDHLVAMQLPMSSHPVTVYVHERVAPALQQVIDNLRAEEAKGNYYEIRWWDTWSYHAATVPPNRHLSFHAVGAAIDINSTTNPYRTDNVLITDMPDWFVQAWTDAGWCWGGHWQTKKDPMHFSWEGPILTPGYSEPEPMPPNTAAGDFDRAVTFQTAAGAAPENAVQLVIDMDRDGAPDAVRISDWTLAGNVGIEACEARHGFETCWTSFTTSLPPQAGATLLLADRTRNGRPDLWEIRTSGDYVKLSVHTYATNYSRRLPTKTTSIPTVADAVYLVADHDRDRHADIYVIVPGDPTTVEVWRGPRFTERIVAETIPIATDGTWRFALGNRDNDAIPDLFVLSPDQPARLTTFSGDGGFSGAGQTVTTAIAAHDGTMQTGDLDGDGRDDIYFYDSDASLTVYLGGERGSTPVSELIYWFFEGHELDWTYAAGCPERADDDTGPVTVAAGGGAAVSLYHNPATDQWIAAGAMPRYWLRALNYEGIDIEALDTASRTLFAVAEDRGRRTRVRLFTATGRGVGSVAFGGIRNPEDLVATNIAGTPALGVLYDRNGSTVLVFRDRRGNWLGRIDMPSFDSSEAVPLGDVDGDGAVDFAVLGADGDGPAVRVVALDGTLLSETRLPEQPSALGLAALAGPEGHGPRYAVLLQNSANGRTRVDIVDAGSGTVVFSQHVPRSHEVAITGLGEDLVVAFRSRRNGKVYLRLLDGVTHELLFQKRTAVGFSPQSLEHSPDTGLVSGARRLGDSSVLVDVRNRRGRLAWQAQYWVK